MSFASILYQLLLAPLELIYELVYNFASNILQDYGAAIIPLSLAVNFLLLPFYQRADAIQKAEKDMQNKLAAGVAHIKKTFKGDERFMMLNTYYRQNHYKPIYSLRSSIPLLLQVPFFISAYNFLSNLPDLQGTRFACFSDLSSPDALIRIAGISINLLPILMTLINVISSEIYMKGHPFKDKIQLHGMALIFLVLLYDSPSGLVLYWTLNNVFSLVKNIVNGSKRPKLCVSIFMSLVGFLAFFYAFFSYKGPNNYKLAIILIGLLFHLPSIINLIRMKMPAKTKEAKESSELSAEQKKADNRLFLYGASFLTIMTGLLIPAAVIRSSPAEFVLVTDFHSPLRYVFLSFLMAAGLFLIWCGLFYFLSKPKSRRVFSVVLLIMSIAGTVNYMLFAKHLTSLTSDLKYEGGMSFSTKEIIINLAAVAAICVILPILWKKKHQIVSKVFPLIVIAVFGMSIYNMVGIQQSINEVREVVENQSTELATFQFSKKGKNVVVFMLDRAVSCYVPYFFQENPDLAKQFDGFTWYPNTLSFGVRTNTAAPALFGGYDYTPDQINARADELLENKHNEALKVMPVLFDQAGYQVTVCDPPYAGYGWIPDLSIYDEYPDIRAFNTEIGQFRDQTESNILRKQAWKRNFFCYSFMKVMPLPVQYVIYQDGAYFSPGSTNKVLMQSEAITTSKPSVGVWNPFMNAYSALSSLSDMTKISEGDENNFLMMQNGTAHNVMMLQVPGYVPAKDVDNTEFESTHQDRFTLDGKTLEMDNAYKIVHYQCNMAALLQMGKWMDYLREQGVYDNTRIIIVADHGWTLGHFDNMIFGTDLADTSYYNPEDAMGYNPLLLVKDFGSTGPVKTDYTFMTNADTPSLAMMDLLDSPINPFTGRAINRPEEKQKDSMLVMYTDNWSVEFNNGNTFSGCVWFNCRNQNIFEKENWSRAQDQ